MCPDSSNTREKRAQNLKLLFAWELNWENLNLSHGYYRLLWATGGTLLPRICIHVCSGTFFAISWEPKIFCEYFLMRRTRRAVGGGMLPAHVIYQVTSLWPYRFTVNYILGIYKHMCPFFIIVPLIMIKKWSFSETFLAKQNWKKNDKRFPILLNI